MQNFFDKERQEASKPSFRFDTKSEDWKNVLNKEPLA